MDNLDDVVEKVKAAGGKVAGEKQTVPGVGDTIYITDTEDNTIGLLQPLPNQAAA